MEIHPDIQRLLDAASDALATAWSSEVNLYLQHPIRTEWGRHRLLLCNVDGPPGTPDIAVVKAAIERTGTIFNEWAALDYLDRTTAAPLVPQLHAGHAKEQLIVIEDLGAGPSLHRLMQTRPSLAEEALIQSMELLADVHAATRAGQGDFDEIRAALPPGAGPPALELDADAVLGTLRAWSNDVPPQVADDVERAAEQLRVAESFTCLTFHDCCPVNRIMTNRGMRAVDLEMAAFRHPLVDGAYAALAHLRCSARRLRSDDGIVMPADVAARATEAYRLRVASGYPEYGDQGRFHRDLGAAAVIWMVEILRRMRPSFAGKDPAGFFKVTARQRVFEVLATIAALAAVGEHAPAVASWADGLGAELRATWPSTPPMLHAAAFAGHQ